MSTNKLNGGLKRLHGADDDTVNWLKTMMASNSTHHMNYREP